MKNFNLAAAGKTPFHVREHSLGPRVGYEMDLKGSCVEGVMVLGSDWITMVLTTMVS